MLPYQLALQLLLAPLVQHPHAAWSSAAPKWLGPPLHLAGCGAHALGLASTALLLQPQAAAQGQAQPGSAGGADVDAVVQAAAHCLMQWEPRRLLLVLAPPEGQQPRPVKEAVSALTLAAGQLGFMCQTLEQVVAWPQFSGMQERERIAAVASAADAAVMLIGEQEAGAL